jgi:antitoxin (DNA-binding transcriptional repressor) of toxin-antitoxin stability system
MEQNSIGIEEARAQLGNLADKAHDEGTITHLTRYGRRIASIVPAGVHATAAPDKALEAAMAAAWPGLPGDMTLGEARRRTIAALNAAWPHLAGAVTAGARVTVPDYSVPEDWPRGGEVVEVGDETVVVELDNGHRQELPLDEVTLADDTTEQSGHRP